MNATVAGAPVSFGVFEMTPDDAEVLEPDDMLSILHEAGYGGVDLGPVGYFGRGEELRRRLDRWRLELAGGWVELPLSDDAGFEAALPSLDDALRVFADAAEAGPRLLPKPTLADHGSPARKARPGRGAVEHSLDDAAWERLIANTQRAADRVRAAGFEPTFHHHAGTFVESPEEIDRFLDRVDVGLTLDTGHLVIGGGDPLEVLQRWGTRVNHLHVKDVDLRVLERVLAAGGGMADVWSSGAFVAFGTGDIDVTAVMNAVDALGFTGWVVVEQDVLPGRDISLADFRSQREADQRLNREVLRQWC
ncbi:TIM barrel protein [Agromyces sp. ISL-38]|uniref:sugar phosphate isomerase/epimerase family protein n=1 Tax=Agromyces sp. ISL-38 TaxID=2819107 RepID=UPI001BE766BD|nr:sugar phosphate isomerase/epimerase [Agromyces sp. ISL-38]MBT2499550.1 TIM barrel protein [Agromyces sp. ISL-38]